MITLREDQAQLKSDIYSAWDSGAQNVLAVLPTGGGKSIVVSDIVLDNHRLGKTQMVFAHRNELVSQMSMHIARRGIRHRLVAAKSTISEVTAAHRLEFGGRSFVDPTSDCAVGSVQTLIARADTLKHWCQQVDDWTLDEAHHAIGNENRERNLWGKAVNLFPRAKGLGVTASPARADGLGLGRHADGPFDAMVLGPDMRTLIDMGALCDYQIVCPSSDIVNYFNDDDFAASGDLSPVKGREASKKSQIVGDVVREYVNRAYGKKFICFATDVETANDIAARFNAVGIPVAAVSAKTPAAVRADYLRRFKAGQLFGLINVDLFDEGLDVPGVEVIIMARPTGSLPKYLQMFGRGLRVLFGKAFALIIDHVSNVLRHGLPDKPHAWTLDRRERASKRERDPEEIELTACRGCTRPYLRCLPACPYCGWSPPLPEPGARTIAMVDGDLTLLSMEMLAQMRAAATLEAPGAIAERVGAVAGAVAGAGAANRSMEHHTSQAALADAIALWAGYQRAAGRSDAESYRRFWLTLGVDVSGALALSRKDMDVVRAKVEGWCK